MRRTTATAVALAVLAGLSACSDDAPEAKPVDKPKTESTPSSSPTPTPTPTPSDEPLSRFEDDPAVQVIRQWAAAVGKDINAKDRAISAQRPLLTAKAAEVFPVVVDEEISTGVTYPGPVPLTPVRVGGSGASKEVTTCTLTGGWGVDPKTNAPAGARKVTAYKFSVVKQGGAWKIDVLAAGAVDCADVSVKGEAW